MPLLRHFQVRSHLGALVPGLVTVVLMLVWAAHDGGFNDDTWYWGALVTLAVLGAAIVLLSGGENRLSRRSWAAIGLFGLYVAWSYLSITWAQAPGLALNGSNRALLYLLIFTLLTVLPWTTEGATVALLVFAIGVGAIAVVLLLRLASADHVGSLIIEGRLASPTGYYNSTAALFMTQALVAVGLGSRREIPGLLRGLLLALAGASLQLAVVVQSRGWLFTLPIVLVIAVFVCRDRVRVALAAVIPAALALIPVHRLLQIYDNSSGAALNQTATHAGREALVLVAGGFVVATLLAWVDQLRRPRRTSVLRRRLAAGAVLVVAVVAGGAGALVVTHGRPFQFISRQWRGFSQPEAFNTTSHFTDVGSSRYDFWRVSLDAFLSHPIGGLGQDNFADYYVKHRHTSEEPSWTHSLELRLLTHTGIVGFLLFGGFLLCAVAAVGPARRRGPPMTAAIAAVALLPLVDWVVHGSIDWFWEMPALSGPALGFLGMAAALAPARLLAGERSGVAGATADTGSAGPEGRRRGAGRIHVPRPVTITVAAVLGVAAVIVLAIPYLAVRKESIASNISATNPAGALADLATAAQLNPLDSTPGRTAGAIALLDGELRTAQARFEQSIQRDPGGWFAWLGAGLAASGLHERQEARHDFTVAYSINKRQPAVGAALRRINSAHPLTSAEAFKLLVVVG